MDEPNTPGGRIRLLLETRGMTAADLAREVLVTDRVVDYWLKNERGLKGTALVAVARVLETTPEWILRGPSAEERRLSKLVDELREQAQKLERENARLRRQVPKAD